jgi:hypothetical protein
MAAAYAKELLSSVLADHNIDDYSIDNNKNNKTNATPNSLIRFKPPKLTASRGNEWALVEEGKIPFAAYSIYSIHLYLMGSRVLYTF